MVGGNGANSESDSKIASSRREYLKLSAASTAALTGVSGLSSSATADHDEVVDQTPSGTEIGGGKKYLEQLDDEDRVTRDDARPENIIGDGEVEEFLEAIDRASSGDVIWIENDAELDITGENGIGWGNKSDYHLSEGVTIASGRGIDGAEGGLIQTTDLDSISNGGVQLFWLTTNKVRITGLRFQGPGSDDIYFGDEDKETVPKKNTERWDPDDYYGDPDYDDFAATGIRIHGDDPANQDIEIDNCRFYGWWHGGLVLGSANPSLPASAYVHHCCFHHNQMDGYGYGVDVRRGHPLIEYCYFDYNRHSIDGSGRDDCGYTAQFNIIGENPMSHAFDMHAQFQNWCRFEPDGNTAGNTIKIRNNTFRFDRNQSGNKEEAIKIRGIPNNECEIKNNWFYHEKDLEEQDTDASEKGVAYKQANQGEFKLDLETAPCYRYRKRRNWSNRESYISVSRTNNHFGGEDNPPDDSNIGAPVDGSPGGGTPDVSEITITVTDPDGNPLAGAFIQGSGDEHSSGISTEFDGETDENGVLSKKIYENTYDLTISHPDFDDDHTVRRTHQDGPTSVTVALGVEKPDTATLEVTVTDRYGTPLSGVLIEGEGDSHPSGVPTTFEGETDSNGVLSKTIYENTYEITASHSEYLSTSVDHTHDGETQVEFTLFDNEPDTATIEVTVTDANGNPLEGVSIEGDGEEHPSGIRTQFGDVTDENGVYSNVIYENTYEITASHPEYLDETIDHTHDGDTTAEFALESAKPDVSEITVTVTDTNGSPISGVTIEGDGEEHPADIPTTFSDKTDENGIYTNSIYENTYEVSVNHPDYYGQKIEHTHDGETHVEFELYAKEPDVSEIEIAVTDRNGTPLEHVVISGSGEEHPSGIPTQFGGVTDENGVYTNTIYENDYEITFTATNFTDETIDHTHDGDTSVDLSLEAEQPGISEIRVTVVDENYRTVEGASIEGNGTEHPTGIPTRFTGETDENGEYTNTIYENDYEITASHPEAGDGVVYESHEGGTWTGIILDSS